MLSRLYWYMVEFGLIRGRTGLAVYGAGILSSKGETVYSIESPEPQRLRFELTRVMRTDYRIDTYQRTYFVLESYQELFDACYGTDFMPLYERFGAAPPIPAQAHLPGDRPVPPAARSQTAPPA
jgi:phenylalanine-4-hydroxylase